MTEQPAQPGAEEPSEEADGRSYRVSLPMFEGPLDLLLHLIQKHELDILDIPIGFIAKKYVEYIRMMEEFSIDLASEYLVMAATLAHIKSRSLLPPDPTQEAEDDLLEEEDDPRAELIRRLLEYQKYKHAADSLGGREVLGRDVFARGLATEPSPEEAPLAPLSLFKLMDAFEGVLKRAKQVEEHQINFELISISERIGQIVDVLRLRGGTLRFEQLFDGDITRADMIVTFLALLEMTKLRMTRLTQAEPLAPIVVELAVPDGETHEFEPQRVSDPVDRQDVSDADDEEDALTAVARNRPVQRLGDRDGADEAADEEADDEPDDGERAESDAADETAGDKGADDGVGEGANDEVDETEPVEAHPFVPGEFADSTYEDPTPHLGDEAGPDSTVTLYAADRDRSAPSFDSEAALPVPPDADVETSDSGTNLRDSSEAAVLESRPDRADTADRAHTDSSKSREED